MNSNDRVGEADALAGLKFMKPKELARQTGRDLVVPEGATLELKPTERELAHAFVRVQIASFEDAQVMGFIPRKLPQEKVMQAISEDDATAYKMASTGYKPADFGCECQGEGQSKPAPLSQIYRRARYRNNPALATLMSDKMGLRMAFDSPLVASVHKWVNKSRLSMLIVTALFEDITINRNATLSVAPSAKTLWAHDIWIHRTGTLRQQGSYLRIWANSLNTFNDFIDASTMADLKKVTAPWRLDA